MIFRSGVKQTIVFKDPSIGELIDFNEYIKDADEWTIHNYLMRVDNRPFNDKASEIMEKYDERKK